MSALVVGCVNSDSRKNTRIKCGDKMEITAAIVLMPSDAQWDDDDEEDFQAYLIERLRDVPSRRWYIIFGSLIPISSLVNNKVENNYETLPDGSKEKTRDGNFSRTYGTTKGGECYAKILRSFAGTDMAFIEIDVKNKVKRQVVSDGLYSGFATRLIDAPIPDLTSFDAVYKNYFLLEFGLDFIDYGEIAHSQDNLKALAGLQDLKIVSGGSTTTDGSVSINLIQGGVNYSTLPTVAITGGGGSGATAVAVLAGTGGVKSLAVSTGGTGYNNGTFPLTFTGNGTGAAGTATIAGGIVTGLSLLSAGQGYSTITVALGAGAGAGTGFAGTVVLGFSLASITTTAGGAGYTSNPTVAITGGTPTTPATASGVLSHTLKVRVLTECGASDLTADSLLGAALANPANFVAQDANGNVLTINSVVLVGKLLYVTGAFPSGTTVTLSGGVASVLSTNLNNGYEIVDSLDVTI